MTSALPNPSGAVNVYTLAADGAAEPLLTALRADPSLAGAQDATGYSLVHALASYDRVALLRRVHAEFGAAALRADLTDEDGETPLFVVETVAAARCLVEELGVDWRHVNLAGETAEQKIRAEGDFVTVADYLGEVRRRRGGGGGAAAAADDDDNDASTGETAGSAVDEADAPTPPLPDGVKMQVGTMTAGEQADLPEPDPEFRRRIEELAARDDFQSDEGQAQLRQLIQDAVRGVSSDDRDVRQRTE